MPVIEKTKVCMLGQSFERVIKCNVHGEFSLDLPDHIAEHNTHRTLKAYTKDGLMKILNDLVASIEKTFVTSKKIILYRISTQYMGVEEGSMIQVAAKVYHKEVTKYEGHPNEATKVQYTEVMGESDDFCGLDYGVTTSFIKQYQEMDWTPERHDFFRRVGEGMQALKIQFKQLKEAPDLAQLIEEGFPLLEVQG